MKTKEKLAMKADGLKTCASMLGKAGYGVKLATIFGYKIGYSMAKHPVIHKVKKQIGHHPKATLITLMGLVLGIIGAVGFVALKEKA